MKKKTLTELLWKYSKRNFKISTKKRKKIWKDRRAKAEQRPETTIKELLQAVFSMGSVPMLYSEGHREVGHRTMNNCAGED
jgi:exonuclease I